MGTLSKQGVRPKDEITITEPSKIKIVTKDNLDNVTK